MVFKSQFAPVVPDEKYKDLVSNFFWHQLDKFAERVLFVDYATGREWTGAQIKLKSATIARNLINKCALRANSDTISFWYHNDENQLLSLGILFAGASVCVIAPEDPEEEHEYALKTIKPQLLFLERKLVKEALTIRERSALLVDLVVMDDDKMDDKEWQQLLVQHTNRGARIFGFHRHLFENETSTEEVNANTQLPIQVHPDRPAFVLLTSGSTGRPKPVGRSQKNSLYVCHSFYGREVARAWELNGSTVMAGHLQLDHGTGTFCLKQALAHGFKLIIVHGYDYATLLDAIRRYRITDCLLGSALLHNFATKTLSSAADFVAGDDDLSSLRNFLAIGSPISSHQLASDFMARFTNCSIRQAYGMTEAGFVCVSDRSAQNLGPVGSLLPNLEVKLVSRLGNNAGAEIVGFNEEGEVYVRGPTVSPGYLGEQFREQSRLNFLPDGFYKSNDIGRVLEPGCQLQIRGRYSEILCLHDGWKVLPGEIEHVILGHPQVKEAVVFGIAHPELPTCHAPRAYVVPKDGVEAEFDEDFQRKLDDLQLGNTQLAPANGTTTTTTTTTSPSNLVRELEEGAKGLKMAQHFRRFQHETADGQLKAGADHGAPGDRLDKQHLFNYTASLMSEPKHLVGGIRILHKLPQISIGKFDKKLLRKLDGFS